MNKEKALKNQGLEFREDISVKGGWQHEIIRNRLKKSETELFVLFPVPFFRFFCLDDLLLLYFIFHEPDHHGKNIFGWQSGNHVPDSSSIHHGICHFLYVLF